MFHHSDQFFDLIGLFRNELLLKAGGGQRVPDPQPSHDNMSTVVVLASTKIPNDSLAGINEF